MAGEFLEIDDVSDATAKTKAEKEWLEFLSEAWEYDGVDWSAKHLCYGAVLPFS